MKVVDGLTERYCSSNGGSCVPFFVSAVSVASGFNGCRYGGGGMVGKHGSGDCGSGDLSRVGVWYGVGTLCGGWWNWTKPRTVVSAVVVGL